MKVGKVIKIKAVEVNRLLSSSEFCGCLFFLLSCSDGNDEQRIDEEQKEGIGWISATRWGIRPRT